MWGARRALRHAASTSAGSPCKVGTIELNGRCYTLPVKPVAVVCLDGCEDDYFTAALVRGRMPNLQRFYVDGFRSLARCALPSFTNPNNVGIVTGLPPSVHGISGNFFFDEIAKEEVMMNDRRFMRAGTVLKAAEDAGRKVAVITSKHKLHPLLSWDLDPSKSILFSVEKTADASKAANGIGASDIRKLYQAPENEQVPAVPDIYSAEASVFLLRAGAALVRQGVADFLYLSTTDYMQHKYAPTSSTSLDFYAAIDRELGNLLDAGAIVGVTADHGMNAKVHDDSSPQVLYLSEALKEMRAGQDSDLPRILLPITDPYVRHHGSLGGFATIYLSNTSPEQVEEVQRRLLLIDGVAECYTREVAAVKLELPADRIGDLTLLADRHTVFGKTPADHELSEVAEGLRSHGSRYEQMVPFILSQPLQEKFLLRAEAGLRNFDIFEATTSWVDLQR